VFLHICEERGIEPEAQLKTTTQSAGIYAQLAAL
jgi:hypothetical protein